MNLQGRQALHRRVARRLARLQADDPWAYALPRGVHRARHQEHPRAQGPDHLAAGPRRLRRRRRRQGRHRFTGLNFIVEHVGLPRLEDFCWIATQEPNVYGGLAVAIPFIHTRPRYFAQIIGELLYWIGEDQILFASDYALWTAEVAGREVRRLPDPGGHAAEYAPDHHRPEEEDPRLNAAALYDINVPAELQLRDTGDQVTVDAAADAKEAGAAMTAVRPRGTLGARGLPAALDAALAPCSTPSWTSRSPTRVRRSSGGRRRGVSVHLRLPTAFCSPNFAYLMASDA